MKKIPLAGTLFLVIPLILLTSCKRFVFHPNEVRPQEKNLNGRNIARINQLPQKQKYKFILIGDTQRFYEELDDFVDHVNSLDDIDFVLLDGDLVDFGLNNEFNWIAERLVQLKVPFISAIGNHDMLANGRKIFNEMFGPENFTFSYSGSKFIVLNTNSREVKFDGTVPNLNWLQAQFTDAHEYQNIFVLSHVAPYSLDFDKSLETGYSEMLAAQSKVRISLHGHEHRYELSTPYDDGVPYLLAGAGDDRDYALISVDGTNFTITEKEY